MNPGNNRPESHYLSAATRSHTSRRLHLLVAPWTAVLLTCTTESTTWISAGIMSVEILHRCWSSFAQVSLTTKESLSHHSSRDMKGFWSGLFQGHQISHLGSNFLKFELHTASLPVCMLSLAQRLKVETVQHITPSYNYNSSLLFVQKNSCIFLLQTCCQASPFYPVSK